MRLKPDAKHPPKRKATLPELRERLITAISVRADAGFSAWTQELLNLTLEDVGIHALPSKDRKFVFNELSRLLAEGAQEGWWAHTELDSASSRARRARHATPADRRLLLEAEHLRAAIAAGLGDLLASQDPDVLMGGLILNATLVGAVVHSDFLSQLTELPHRRELLQEAGGSASIAFQIARAGSPNHRCRRKQASEQSDEPPPEEAASNVRRWTPDDASALLLARLFDLAPTRERPSPDRSLSAVCARLGRTALTMKQVVRHASAWWASRLPPILYEYVSDPRVAPSLPHSAWQRLLTGRPALAEAPRPSSVTEGLRIARLGSMSPSQAPAQLMEQQRACRGLVAALGKGPDKQVPKPSELVERLEKWRHEFGHIDGWPALFECWARHVVTTGNAIGMKLHRAGLQRYLQGFGDRWLKVLHDLDPWAIVQDPAHFANDISDRLEQLRHDLSGLQQAGVPRAGLQAFLAYVTAIGGPKIELDSEWRSVVSVGRVDVNIVTPGEYKQLLCWLSEVAGADRFGALRNQALTILAYRIGPRWEELQTRQRHDLMLTTNPDGSLCGILDIRVNRWFAGKTSKALRRLPLEQFLTPDEMSVLQEYLALLDRDDVRPTELLFANRETRGTPPNARDTHDVIQRGMRLLSGDESLVFHHLRHSAASFISLRIFTDEIEDPSALVWINEHASISARGLGIADKPYAEILSGRRAEHGSRSQLVRAVLGHIDPTTSMHSYVHFMDVILARYTKRLAPAIPIAVRARLDGIKRKSVVRRDIRARQRA